jgi:signal peptidase I
MSSGHLRESAQLNGVTVSEEQVVDHPTEGPTEPSLLRRAAGRILEWFKETTFVIVLALALSVVLRTFFFQAFYVPSTSMVETLAVNDRIIASKLSYTFGDVQRGDIIVFQDPGGWLPEPPQQVGVRATIARAMQFLGVLPANSGNDLVKRVVGLPGDRVVCCTPDGNLKINGVEVIERGFTQSGTDIIKFNIVVPEGRVFVMGDNRGSSSDSRSHLDVQNGTVPIDNIVGQVTLLIWPFDRFQTMPAPTSYQSVPAAK